MLRPFHLPTPCDCLAWGWATPGSCTPSDHPICACEHSYRVHNQHATCVDGSSNICKIFWLVISLIFQQSHKCIIIVGKSGRICIKLNWLLILSSVTNNETWGSSKREIVQVSILYRPYPRALFFKCILALIRFSMIVFQLSNSILFNRRLLLLPCPKVMSKFHHLEFMFCSRTSNYSVPCLV